ncbi:MAG: N-acetyltransferase [Flavipsychrobacter sp.]|jgi:RimJ/RimL family protein N-acetyltransferase|nr:N-acetyltransferase [Flavipsychrobacter sp.]
MVIQKHYFLTTDRIGFRAWDLADVDIAMELRNDLVATGHIKNKASTGIIYRKLLTEQKILKLYNVQYWPIFQLKKNIFIGCCGLRPYDPNKKIYEVGVFIKQQFWRKGYATEAARAMVGYAFNNLDAVGLCAGHSIDNAIQKRLLQKLGFDYFYDEYHSPSKGDRSIYLLQKALHDQTCDFCYKVCE